MLIVQRITTDWTKASRGGSGATLRNAVPEVFALPAISEGDVEFLIHDIHASETEGFIPRETLTTSNRSAHLQLGVLLIGMEQNLLCAKFVWSWHECGAPERPSETRFRLEEGQWGQFVCNGRFGAQSSTGREWGYRKSVFNLTFHRRFNPDVFINSAQTIRKSLLASLW